jgi:tetratricopeptide (TPR) repeat protein
VGDLRGIAAALDNLASAVADIEADLQTAQKLVEEALIIFRQLDARGSMGNAMWVYAYILAWKGEFLHARQTLQEYLEIVRQSEIPLNIVLGEVQLAGLDRLAGREEHALIVLEESLRTMKASDPRLIPSWNYSTTLHELAYILARRGETERAGSLLREAWEKSELPEERALLLHCRGTIAMVEQNGAGALADYLESLKICRGSNLKLTAILAMEGIADALRLLSDSEQATRLLSATAAFRCKIGAPVSPWDRPVYERIKAALIHQLGEAAFAEAWTAGQVYPFEQAVEEALAIQSGSA